MRLLMIITYGEFSEFVREKKITHNVPTLYMYCCIYILPMYVLCNVVGAEKTYSFVVLRSVKTIMRCVKTLRQKI